MAIVLLEHFRGVLTAHSLLNNAAAIGAARLVAGDGKLPIGVVSVGKEYARDDMIDRYKGHFSKLVFAQDPSNSVVTSEGVAQGMLQVHNQLLGGAKCTWITAHSSHGKAVLPRFGGLLLRGNPDSSITMVGNILSINAKKRLLQRATYAGNIIETVSMEETADVQLFSVRPTGAFALSETVQNSKCEIVDVKMEPCSLSVWRDDACTGLSNGVDLSSAHTVVAGGRALRSKADFDRLICGLARAIDPSTCAVGATRAAVDDGLAPNEVQIGQTGRIVSPVLYIGIGISGAIQHVSGMRTAQCIIAINNDPQAAIFRIAHVGLVANLYDVLDPLIDLVSARPRRAGP